MALKYKEDTVNNYYAYLTEDGSDSNSGLTPALPVKTMDKLVQVLEAYTGAKRRVGVIVKHKFVNEGIATTRTKPITFECLNRTIFEFATTNIYFTVSKDRIVNCKCDYNIAAATGITVYFDNCIFDGDGIRTMPVTTSNIIVNYSRCVIKSFRLLNTTAFSSMTNCVVVNCSSYKTGVSYNSWGSMRNTVIAYCPNLQFFTTLDNFLFNCNIYGNVLLDGVSSDNSDLITAGLNVNGIDADPLFNDSSNNVYTVTSSSPCLYSGTNNQHIGIGEAYYLTGLELLTDAVSSSNLEASGNKLIRANSDNDASLETKIFDIGSYKIISLVDLAATLGFVLDDLVQSVQLDSADNPYPYFLTFKIKVSDTSGGIATAPWIVLPFQQQPTTDLDGVGNGSTVWDETETQEYVKARYLKLYIYVQNLT